MWENCLTLIIERAAFSFSRQNEILKVHVLLLSPANTLVPIIGSESQSNMYVMKNVSFTLPTLQSLFSSDHLISNAYETDSLKSSFLAPLLPV